VDGLKVGQRVRIKDADNFTQYPLVQQAFARALYQGVIVRIELDAEYLPYNYVVATPDRSQHEWFTPQELEPIEGEL